VQSRAGNDAERPRADYSQPPCISSRTLSLAFQKPHRYPAWASPLLPLVRPAFLNSKLPAFMSQHSNLATVWEHLLGRTDLPEVLREIIGQHALQFTFIEHKAHPYHKTYETIIWIRIIFDLQRCYLNGHTTGAAEIPSHMSAHLLPPDLLLSSVLYLISAKSRLTSSEDAPLTYEPIILAQAIMSGLRLLLWQKQCISPREKWLLQTAIAEAWKDDHMREVESCIVQQVFPALLEVIQDTDHIDAYRMERENTGLPTYASGLVSILTELVGTSDVNSIP
jgi:hypothetical protein